MTSFWTQMNFANHVTYDNVIKLNNLYGSLLIHAIFELSISFLV